MPMLIGLTQNMNLVTLASSGRTAIQSRPGEWLGLVTLCNANPGWSPSLGYWTC